MTANYYRFHDLTDHLFYGVALTDEHMNEAALKVAEYLRDNGAADITEKLGLFLQEHVRDGKVWRRRICYRLTGKELTPVEIGNIGLFLPYGALYGKCGM